MAIAFARIDVHTRTKGHSAVAGAAYRAGAKLIDERTGETFDFTHRADVKYHAVLLPEGANPKFRDQQLLWNAAELAEKRKDAQVAKDLKLALPRDVSDTHLIELARNFAIDNFVSKGIVADVSIHDDQDGNPHGLGHDGNNPV